MYLANLTFTGDLGSITGERITPTCIEVTADTVRIKGNDQRYDPRKEEFYFPEMWVARWFREKEKQEVPVYLLDRTGVEPLRCDDNH